jgi:hypothetical protein
MSLHFAPPSGPEGGVVLFFYFRCFVLTRKYKYKTKKTNVNRKTVCFFTATETFQGPNENGKSQKSEPWR